MSRGGRGVVRGVTRKKVRGGASTWVLWEKFEDEDLKEVKTSDNREALYKMLDTM